MTAPAVRARVGEEKRGFRPLLVARAKLLSSLAPILVLFACLGIHDTANASTKTVRSEANTEACHAGQDALASAHAQTPPADELEALESIETEVDADLQAPLADRLTLRRPPRLEPSGQLAYVASLVASAQLRAAALPRGPPSLAG